ncbi:MAG TPA: hypothetical protein VHK69_02895 [Chitinophagaceae bacterium]|nr:hypothetical protein [Chitinophagaceae bacterium]
MHHPENRQDPDKQQTSIVPPDPETLHKTDPQENMEGPMSSGLKGIGEAFDTNESKEEADEERDRNL